MPLRTFTALLAGLLMSQASARAASIAVTLDVFLQHVQPGYQIATFQNVSLGVLPSTLNISAGAYQFQAFATSGLYGEYVPGSATDRALSVNDRANDLVFTFAAGTVTAVGGYFYATNGSGAFVSGVTEVMVSDGSTRLVDLAAPNFVGFIADPGEFITSLSVSMGTVVTTRWHAANDLYLGQALREPDAQVPEPAAWMLLAPALLAMAAATRRRFRRT